MHLRDVRERCAPGHASGGQLDRDPMDFVDDCFSESGGHRVHSLGWFRRLRGLHVRCSREGNLRHDTSCPLLGTRPGSQVKQKEKCHEETHAALRGHASTVYGQGPPHSAGSLDYIQNPSARTFRTTSMAPPEKLPQPSCRRFTIVKAEEITNEKTPSSRQKTAAPMAEAWSEKLSWRHH